MRRVGPVRVACPDRMAEYRAALEALEAIPIEYAGELPIEGSSPLPVLSPATVDALVAGAEAVAALERPCPLPTECPSCAAIAEQHMRSMFSIVRRIAETEHRTPADEVLGFARHGGGAGRFRAEWSWWYRRLATHPAGDMPTAVERLGGGIGSSPAGRSHVALDDVDAE